MPKANSAAKRARASERKRQRNQSVKSRIRNALKRLDLLLKEDVSSARSYARQVISLLDRAAKTRVMHVNASRRYKSRIMARVLSLKNS